MRDIEYSGQFKKDVKIAQKRHHNMDKLKNVMDILVKESAIPSKYKDYGLTDNWKNYRDIHIEPDWILIYTIYENTVRFERTGSHADLF